MSDLSLRARDAWMLLRERKLGLLGALIIAAFAFMALFANYLSPYGVGVSQGDLTAILSGPTLRHPLGTDELGRDILTLIMYGGRVSLTVGVTASFTAVGLGSLVGVVAGFYGKLADTVLMRGTDILFVMPVLPLVLVLSALIGPSVTTVILVIALTNWPFTARTARSQVLSLREAGYVEASRGLGAGNLHLMFRHIFPNIWPPIIALAVLGVQNAILIEAGLSFLGLGDPNAISWGTLLQEAFTRGALAGGIWWYWVPPGVAIALVTLGFILVGQMLDDIVNPRIRSW